MHSAAVDMIDRWGSSSRGGWHRGSCVPVVAAIGRLRSRSELTGRCAVAAQRWCAGSLISVVLATVTVS
jgi:hypothetical protein